MMVYVAIGWDGKPRPWTISPVRKETMQRATETMMGASEYHRLETLGRRWAHCYRNGTRIVRATVTIDTTPKEGGDA